MLLPNLFILKTFMSLVLYVFVSLRLKYGGELKRLLVKEKINDFSGN